MAAVCSRHPPPPTPRASGLVNLEELSSQQLRDIIEELQQQQKNICLSLQIPRSPPITIDMVIDFIKEVDYADRFWDLYQYLTDLPILCANKDWISIPYLKDLPIAETSDEVFYAYLKRLDQDEKKFDLDEIDIWHCVSCHISYLEGKIRLMRQAEEIEFADAKYYTARKQIEPQMDRYAFKHPIWKLVLQARKNEYVMNKNPRLELERIIACVPLHYFRHNTLELPRDQEKTVMLPNVSPHTTMWEVKKLLSDCGEIDFSEVESGRGKPITIYVIFEDPQGAKAALEKESLEVGGRVVKIKPPQPPFVPHKVSRAAQEVEALVKYRRLIAKFTQLSNDVKDNVEEDVSGIKGARSSAINTENAKKGVKPEKKHKSGPSWKKVRTRSKRSFRQ